MARAPKDIANDGGKDSTKESIKSAPAAGKAPAPAKPDVTSAAERSQKDAMNSAAGSALPPIAPKGVPLTPDKTPTGSIGKRAMPQPVVR